MGRKLIDGGCYVTAPSPLSSSVRLRFEEYCRSRGVPFSFHDSVISPDPSTLFTTSGMQKHKSRFTDPHERGTLSDIQHCLRLNDLDEIGDGTHYLDFYMLGLFSFREMSLSDGIGFWMEFLDLLGIKVDEVTVHPDKEHWKRLYSHLPVKVRLDPECTWSDGQIKGYCTEFYVRGVEIGNIVNPGEDCLDCGFGLERLQQFCNQQHNGYSPPPTEGQILLRTIGVLLGSGVEPGPRRQPYILRSLIRKGLRLGLDLPDHRCVEQERRRLVRVGQNLERLRRKYPDKSVEYFWQTHGIHPEDWE